MEPTTKLENYLLTAAVSYPAPAVRPRRHAGGEEKAMVSTKGRALEWGSACESHEEEEEEERALCGGPFCQFLEFFLLFCCSKPDLKTGF